jgi:hypothetical protein
MPCMVDTYLLSLVAAMHVHAVPHLLTFNAADFRRYLGITALHPQDI